MNIGGRKYGVRLCRAMGLHDGHMHSVKNGERKSHKGWMLLEGSEEE